MRDVIWTLIVIWLVYKVVAIFKNNSQTQKNQYTSAEENRASGTQTNKDENIRSAVKKHLNNEGEYVDYEEIK